MCKHVYYVHKLDYKVSNNLIAQMGKNLFAYTLGVII